MSLDTEVTGSSPASKKRKAESNNEEERVEDSAHCRGVFAQEQPTPPSLPESEKMEKMVRLFLLMKKAQKLFSDEIRQAIQEEEDVVLEEELCQYQQAIRTKTE